MKFVTIHAIKSRLFIFPLLLLVALSFTTMGCSAVKAVSKDNSSGLTAKTSYDNNSENCTSDGEVKYEINFKAPGKIDARKELGSMCGIDNSTDITLGNSTKVQVQSVSKADELKKCTNGGVYISIAKYKSATKKDLLTPFHTNAICYGEINDGGNNDGGGDSGDGDGDGGGDTGDGDTGDGIKTIMARLSSHQGHRSSVVAIGDEIHVLYGYERIKGTIRTLSRDHYAYNVKTKLWTNINELESVKNQQNNDGRRDATVDAAAALIGDKLYIYGGRYANEPGPSRKPLTVYDTVAKKWSVVIPDGEPTSSDSNNSSELAAVGSKLYAFGGVKGGMPPDRYFDYDVNDNGMYVFDTASNEKKWTKITTNGPTPSPRMYHRSAVIGSKIYYYGGIRHLYRKNVGVVSDPFVAFDTLTNTWEKLEPFSNVRSRFSLLALDSNTLFVSSGAADGDGSELKSYIYKINTETKQEVLNMPNFATKAESTVTSPGLASEYDNNYAYDYVLAYYVYIDNKIYVVRVQPVDNVRQGNAAKPIEIYTIDIP